jgi:hypothetical protein
MLKRFLFAVLLAGACVASSPIASSQSPAHAPSNFLQRWQARATATQALQPKWIAPVFAPYPMLVQLYRFDGVRQTSSTLSTTWNIGSTKGLALIPLKRTEIDIYIPPFFEHDNKTADGFGDFSAPFGKREEGKLSNDGKPERHGADGELQERTLRRDRHTCLVRW